MAAAIIIPYLNKLPSDYKKAVKALNRKLTKAINVMDKCKYLEAFTDKYSAVPEIFEHWNRLLYFNRLKIGTMFDKRLKAFPQYSLKEWPSLDLNAYFTPEENSAALRNFSEGYLKQIISLPHSKLSAALEFYDEISPVALTAEMLEKYNTACKLYEQIKDADINDGEKYIELLKKANNEECVIKNVEIQLYKNPWCQSLWIAYIDFLENEKKDQKELLHVLRRYCRLFFNEKELKEKYQTKIEELSQNSAENMTEFWIDSIKYEFDFQNVDVGKTLMEKVLNFNFTEETFKNIYDVVKVYVERYKFNEILEKAENIKKRFVKEIPVDTTGYLPTILFDKNTKLQKLPFSKPINQYLYDKISHQHLQKLYQTCKWFYYKYRLNLVHRLTIFTKILDEEPYKFFYLHSANVKLGKITAEMPLKRLWLTHSLETSRITPFFQQKVARNSLKYLDIRSQKISFSNFKFLVSSRSLIKIKFYCVVRDSSDVRVPIEDVLAEISHVRQIRCYHCTVSSQTSEKLLSMKFKNKLETLNVYFTQLVNVNNFFIFLQNNLASNANLEACIYFDGQIDQNFQHDLKQLIETWTPKNEKPIMQN